MPDEASRPSNPGCGGPPRVPWCPATRSLARYPGKKKRWVTPAWRAPPVGLAPVLLGPGPHAFALGGWGGAADGLAAGGPASAWVHSPAARLIRAIGEPGAQCRRGGGARKAARACASSDSNRGVRGAVSGKRRTKGRERGGRHPFPNFSSPPPPPQIRRGPCAETCP